MRRLRQHDAPPRQAHAQVPPLRLLPSFLLVSLALTCGGCGYTLQDINTGVTAGRTFDDRSVFDSGRTAWTVSVSGHYVRDKR